MSIPHNVGYGEGPELGAKFGVPTKPIDPDPLAVDPRAMPPNHMHAGGRVPDQGFVDNLALADDRMVVFWNPLYLGGRWVIWRKQYSGEWSLVTPVCNPDTNEYWPLDNRALAMVYSTDPEKYGGVRQMFMQVRRQAERDKEAAHKRTLDRIKAADEAAKAHAQIRVGYGYSPGNKACEHSHWDKPQKPLTENPIG